MAEFSAGEPGFQVVVFGTPDDPDAMSDALERALGMHATDAHVRARNSPGVLPEHLSRPTADRLAAEIAATGLQAAVVAASDVPVLDDAAVVHHALCLDSGLEVRGLYGEAEQIIPWSDISLISVGQVSQERTRHFLTPEVAAVRSARRTDPGTVETFLTPGPEAWIVGEHPFRALRIDHKQMNYESLGNRKTESASENFRMFLDEIITRVPKAYLTPATRAWLQNGSVDDYSFETPTALERYTVLHLLIHRRAGQSWPE